MCFTFFFFNPLRRRGASEPAPDDALCKVGRELEPPHPNASRVLLPATRSDEQLPQLPELRAGEPQQRRRRGEQGSCDVGLAAGYGGHESEDDVFQVELVDCRGASSDHVRFA